MTMTALRSMKSFHDDLLKCFEVHSLSLEDNPGRRNAYLSHAQEVFFARELAKNFPLARCDGRSGKADIVIPEISCELECKLTTPSSSGSINFQAYGESFGNNKKDFLYVIADSDFSHFAVLHFHGLTREDFGESLPSSQGKVKMKKQLTFSKCNVLHGSYSPNSVEQLSKIESKLSLTKKSTQAYQKLLERKAYWQDASNESFSIKMSPA